VDAYFKTYLDQLLTSGEYIWLRPVVCGPAETKREIRVVAPELSAVHDGQRVDSSAERIGRSGPVRNTPIMLLERTELNVWLPLVSRGASAGFALASDTERVRSVLLEHGATFFADLVRITGLLRTQVERALGELVNSGLVTSDSYAGLRALITPASKRASFSRPRRRGAASVDAGGRWVLLEQNIPDLTNHSAQSGAAGSAWADEAAVEQVALALLDRYGVLFRAVLQREYRGLPTWRQLVRVLRRLEARGEIRGGRFVSSFSGEQFAWPEAVEALRREQKNHDQSRPDVVISAADPLNLAGIVTPGARVPATARNRLLYRGGLPVAVYVGGAFEWRGKPDAAAEWTARNQLIRNDPQLTYIQGSNGPN
jgi:ATP-dependent Lhr-like helicase